MRLYSDGVWLTLRDPNFGDQRTTSISRILRLSRGGTRHVFRYDTWPRYEQLRLQVEALSKDERDLFITFLDHSLGKQVILEDHNGLVWQGIITTPDSDVMQTQRDCGYVIDIGFEGEINGTFPEPVP